ncbi:MAG: xanthine dehydrogenase family protein molybdopterin-binding subunit [Planctomycetota bacterium]|jgi:2-furoyl-CoA dehydrogenase large subunit
MSRNGEWVGKPLRRKEDALLLTGKGSFADDTRFPDLFHAAILRSPYAHARIRSIDAARALALPGVAGVLTAEDVGHMSKPFPAALPARMRYFSAAVDKVRYVGEPVAVVVARDRYVGEDACELIQVDYEPLPAVTDVEEAMAEGAPLLHEELGTNVANHRVLTYGDLDRAFADADVVVKECFRFHKYSSTPIETCVATARYDAPTGVMTIWSNFHGPYSLHSFVAKGLNLPENQLRLITPPDIGGSFGIKIGIISYLTLIGLAAKKTGRTVRWVEDRREHLMALSSGAERTAYYEVAARKDGEILGIRARYLDNNGAYIRAPEPANLYRSTGNTPGPYRIPCLQIDAHAVVTNKSPTGPNRGYGCQQLYFGLERSVDLVAQRLGLDPAAVRQRNLIRPEEHPYTTPSGGVYDSGDFPRGLGKALEMADYEGLRERQRAARADGRLFGVGIALGVEPCVSNMGYLNIAFPPEIRAKRGFHPKSGAGEAATVKIDPMGRVTAVLGSAASGQGHEILVAQVVADALGISPDDINVVAGMDTFTRLWTISSGNYSSRFASAGLSAFANAARQLRGKILDIAAARLAAPRERMVIEDGRIHARGAPDDSLDLRAIAGIAHWNPDALPEGVEPGLIVTHLFNYLPARVIDEQDRVNSSNTYGYIAEVVAVEIDRETGELDILKYVSVHDAGVVINPQRVEGQIWGGIAHGLGGALYEDLAYDERGQFLAGSFMDYLCPTAMEMPKIDVGHICTPSPFSTMGTKGCGEGSTMTAPALLANAASDALAPMGIVINRLPLTPHAIWQAMRKAEAEQ